MFHVVASKLSHVEEPQLLMANGQTCTDPRKGLCLVGPTDLGGPSAPRSIRYLLIGTPTGCEFFRRWSKQMNCPQIATEKIDQAAWVPFPGFEVCFGFPWSEQPAIEVRLDPTALETSVNEGFLEMRTFRVVEHYLKAFQRTKTHDERIDVAICIVPDRVYDRCRIESDGRKNAPVAVYSPHPTLFENKEEWEGWSADFRRQLKARGMKYPFAIQIIRESTLSLEKPKRRGGVPVSERMWRLSSALYYKAGGKPWQLTSARKGVCYLGLTYRRLSRDKNSRSAACAAQVFLKSGDAVAFLGQFGPWYSPETRQFQLTREAARDLMEGTLNTFLTQYHERPEQVFVHCHSEISEEEFQAFQAGCPAGCSVVAVRIRSDYLRVPRLYRVDTEKHTHGGQKYSGDNWPILRGTAWKVSDRTAYLWGSGFKPDVGTDDGHEVPVPMRIDIQHGEADMHTVLADVLGLTKLNYNTCGVGDSLPTTISYAGHIGDILIGNPALPTAERCPQLRRYM